MSKNVTVYRKPFGPIVVKGTIDILDAEGNVIETKEDNCILCGCGKSKDPLICDKEHKKYM